MQRGTDALHFPLIQTAAELPVIWNPGWQENEMRLLWPNSFPCRTPFWGLPGSLQDAKIERKVNKLLSSYNLLKEVRKVKRDNSLIFQILTYITLTVLQNVFSWCKCCCQFQQIAFSRTDREFRAKKPADLLWLKLYFFISSINLITAF